jgi:hypothetical protein
MVGVLLVLQAAHWHILLMVPDADIVLIRLVLFTCFKRQKRNLSENSGKCVY